MKRNITLFVGMLIALLCLSRNSIAQSQDGNISIKITADKNGETQTFEKQYTSIEEMKSDKAYKEFVGEEHSDWLDSDEDAKQKMTISIVTDDEGAYSFSSDDESVYVMNMGKLAEDLAKMEVEIHRMIEEEDVQKKVERIMESIHTDGNDYHFNYASEDDITITVENVEKDDFGKHAIPTSKEKLDQRDLKLKVIGHQIIIKYPIREEAEVSLKLTDSTNELLFASRIKEAKEDLNQVIDLSPHKKGKYLLELQIGDKRLTKKIMIDRIE